MGARLQHPDARSAAARDPRAPIPARVASFARASRPAC